MAQEIERKWLAKLASPITPTRTRIIESAYLSVGDPEIRVARYRGEAGSYQVTAKKGKGIAREEIVVNVGDEQGASLYHMAEHFVSKIRDDVAIPKKYPHNAVQHPWEIDTYLGRYAGIIVVEIELPYKTAPLPAKPEGLVLVKEVTEDPNWKNKAMALFNDEGAAALVREYVDALVL